MKGDRQTCRGGTLHTWALRPLMDRLHGQRRRQVRGAQASASWPRSCHCPEECRRQGEHRKKGSEKDGPLPGTWSGWAGSSCCFRCQPLPERGGQAGVLRPKVAGVRSLKDLQPSFCFYGTPSQISLRPCRLVVKNMGSEARLSKFKSLLCHLQLVLGEVKSRHPSGPPSVSPSVKRSVITVFTSLGGCKETVSYRQSLAQSEHLRKSSQISEVEAGCPGYAGRHKAGNQHPGQ